MKNYDALPTVSLAENPIGRPGQVHIEDGLNIFEL